uniref:Uncharacterized protein n=1 Tax=Rhizophora mucronata TaxID=61149 RepID=A0A2P2P2L1_RHIMU
MFCFLFLNFIAPLFIMINIFFFSYSLTLVGFCPTGMTLSYPWCTSLVLQTLKLTRNDKKEMLLKVSFIVL